MNFSITPVGPFPPSNDEGFPQFIQFQEEGENLGGPDADTVNFVGEGVTATRGTGEDANIITVEVNQVPASNLQFQDNGVDLGAPDATTLNVTGDLTIERTDDTITIGHAPFTWRDEPGDTFVVLSDNNMGISMSGTSGAQTVTLLADTGDDTIDLPDGAAVLVYAEGTATVQFIPQSGVLLRYRDALLAEGAGQFATMTLLKRRANEWILCGDLAAA